MAALAAGRRAPVSFAALFPLSRTRTRLQTPARLRASVAVIVVLAAALATVIAMASAAITNDFQAIGQRDAPEVSAATGLYFSLNDMDAQVANVLLVGNDTALAAGRAQDVATYSSDRATADSDLQQAAVTASGSASAQRELRTVLNDVGQYEALAADAILTDQQSATTDATTGDRPGHAPTTALAYYRQATDLMRTGILPTVSSLTSVNGGELDRTYQAGESRATTGIILIVGAGILLIAALVAFQLYLTRRFRRIINPALAAATVATLAVTIAAGVHLSAEKTNLTVAKVDAFDSVVALSQAQAVSYAANADESRYLVDPLRAAQYQQAFLTESQQVANVGNVGILGYDTALTADISAYDKNANNVKFGGYLGAEFHNITFPGERAAAVRTLLAYQVYERYDRELRALAKTNLAAAVAFDMGTGPGQSDWAFNRYNAALSSVIAVNQNAFTAAVSAGEGGGIWNAALPAAAAALLAALVLLGIRPRLAEYRLLSPERSLFPPSAPASGPGAASDTVFDLPVAPLRSRSERVVR